MYLPLVQAWELLSLPEASICLSVCLSICLSVWLNFGYVTFELCAAVCLFEGSTSHADGSRIQWMASFHGPCGGPCCVHPRHPVLHFEWVNVPGHVVTNDEPSSPPLCWSCGLIPNMHLPNYYETGWINLLDIESSPSKYWPVSIYQVGVTSVCYVLTILKAGC